MFKIGELIDIHLRGLHRLESISMLPLGCTLAEAIARYGNPIETEPSEDTPQITQHTFAVGNYHQVVVNEWSGVIQLITYWSLRSDPGRDLVCVMKAYREAHNWKVMQAGYWYQREDGHLRLWCSAAPAIGIAFTDFLKTRSQLKTAHQLAILDTLPDISWAPNNVVNELQRMFIEEGNDGLHAFAARSDSITVSPDGRHVFIVRNHRASDVRDGFQESNRPGKPGEGYTTQVINCFVWRENGSRWSKVPLPRDANVSRLEFVGDVCHLCIEQTTTARVLRFEGPPLRIIRLQSATVINAGPLIDEVMWKALEDATLKTD